MDTPSGVPLSPLPLSSKQKVVLRDTYHTEHVGGHHRMPHGDDPLFAWEGVVVVIVAAHVLVLLFYVWMLYKDGAAPKGRAARHAGSAKPSVLAAWRTPRDVLVAREKERLGKV
mmetsp:Transcript_71941/g.158861  ORF Transcript_71941/g.158861 Transcript_71941/m.158861 type:complete len:114 (-) Transcript_71941:151-492(-)